MNSERFSKALGELDSKYIEEAMHYQKRDGRTAWIKWAALAAGLCTVICVFMISRYHISDNSDDIPVGDICPMVYVNDTRYRLAQAQPEFAEIKEQFVYIGKILSEVSCGQEPEENFQANDEIAGADVYQYGDDIVVWFEGNYYLYENMENLRREELERLRREEEGVRQNGETEKR